MGKTENLTSKGPDFLPKMLEKKKFTEEQIRNLDTYLNMLGRADMITGRRRRSFLFKRAEKYKLKNNITDNDVEKYKNIFKR
jgi:hypothetical protein